MTTRPSPALAPLGRRYVEAYVPYVHYVEGIWQAANTSAEGHYPEPTAHADR